VADLGLPAFVVLTSDACLPASTRIWGTGGWLNPDRREALDWLTLSTLLGWRNAVIRVDERLPPGGTRGIRWLVVACDPIDLGERVIGWIARQLMSEPTLMVARAGSHGSLFANLAGAAAVPAMITGQSLVWTGPGGERRWTSRSTVRSSSLVATAGAETWATLDGQPCVSARRVGPSVAVTLAFHPSEIRDCDPAGTALIKTLLVSGAQRPVAWLDLEGALVLRMDDAGGAQNVHSRSWQYSKLRAEDWSALSRELERLKARLAVGYSAGWVDDGDASRGRLTVGGSDVPREPGRVYPSSLVLYEDRAGNAPGRISDYRSEFRGIQALRHAGLGDVEVHGFTHMHPDGAAWARADDRFDNVSWFRELGHEAQDTIASRPAERHPLALALESLRDQFGVTPTTAICPGDRWTDDTLERALDLDMQFVGSYYLAVRHGPRFCWCQHVCAPYLDTPDAAWFESELPVIGYFHDRDLALEGTAWMRRRLEAWTEAGARRMIDFRELAGALSRTVAIEETNGGLAISIAGAGGTALVKPLPVLFTSDRGCPEHVAVEMEQRRFLLPAEEARAGIGRVFFPALDGVSSNLMKGPSSPFRRGE
jgi:hypothetical protein